MGQKKTSADEYRKLVRSLRNNNALPVISGKDDKTASYGKKYDWDEQARVLKIVQILTDEIEQDWPVLAEFLDDQEYCITLHGEYSVYVVLNCSIGNVCRQVLVKGLTAGYIEHIPKGLEPWLRLQHPKPLPRDTGKLKAWCNEQHHKGKQLYELQIEMSKWAIAQIPLVRAAEAEKEASIRKVKSRTEELRAEEKPAVLKTIFEREFNYPLNWSGWPTTHRQAPTNEQNAKWRMPSIDFKPTSPARRARQSAPN